MIPKSRIKERCRGRDRKPRLMLAGALTLAFAFTSPSAWAQSCQITSEPTIDMGEVSPTGNTVRSGTLRIGCNRGLFQAAALRFCMYVPDAGQVPGINPRLLTNHNGAQMAYDLFSDPGTSRQIGPYGAGFPDYFSTLSLPPLVFSGEVSMLVYALPRLGQRLPAAYPYESIIPGGQIRYAVNTGLFGAAMPTEAECSASPRVMHFNTVVRATARNTCRIVVSTDLDFGAVTSLPSNRDQTSTIQLQCPTGATWQVGLDNGSHAEGSTRRMAGPAGRFLRYELYRDPQRTQRWGNTKNVDTNQGSGTNSTQTLTVHGRVPAQSTSTPGNYADTVTVTLTY